MESWESWQHRMFILYPEVVRISAFEDSITDLSSICLLSESKSNFKGPFTQKKNYKHLGFTDLKKL